MTQPDTIKRMFGRQVKTVPNPLKTPEVKPLPDLTQTKTQPEKSQIVILTLLLISLGFLVSFAGAIFALAAVGIFGSTITLSGVTLAVLSLRE